MRDDAHGIDNAVVVDRHDVATYPVVIVGLSRLTAEHILCERRKRCDRCQRIGHRVMWYRRTQLGGDVVSTERRHRYSGDGAGHDGQQHTSAFGRPQRAAKDNDRQHRAKGELQPERLVHQRQNRDNDPVGDAPRNRDRLRARDRHRHGEHRQRGGAEEVRPRGVRRKRNPERQQRNQHRDHQPALGPSPAEQNHAHHQHQAAQVDRRRQPAQAQRNRKIVSGHQTDQFAGQATTDEAERVVDGVVRHPIHIERNNVDREAEHRRRPDRNRDRDADVKKGVRALTGFEAQVHHRIGPNRQLLRTDSGQPVRPAPLRVSTLRSSASRSRTRRWSGIGCH